MLRWLALAAAFALALAAPAFAKGPMEIELVISGGDLARDIHIPADVMFRAQTEQAMPIFGYIGTPAPATEPPFMYRLDYWIDDLDTGRRSFVSYLYYPGGDGTRAIVREPECVGTDLGCWGEFHSTFDEFLRAYLAGTPPAFVTGSRPLLGPAVSLAVLIAALWMARRPPIRRRLGRLAY